MSPGPFVFPRGGVHRAGPLGQIELANDLEREWLEQIPKSLQLQFHRIEANDPVNPNFPRDTYIRVERPTVCRIVSATGSLIGSQWFIQWAPERMLPHGNAPAWWTLGFGIPVFRESFYLPSAGTYAFRAQALGAGMGAFAVLAAFDATNPDNLRAVIPRPVNAIVGQADLALGVGNTQILTTLQTLPHTALEVINPNAATVVRVRWGGAASATDGVLLGPTGSAHDRIRYESGRIPLATLNVWKAAAGTISVIRFL